MFELRGRRALITGASSGIGRAIARELAAHGVHVVLTARRHDRLVELAESLGRSHAVAATVIELDLAAEGGATRLIEEVERLHPDGIDILVNNAGVGVWGPGIDHDWEREHTMLMLNVVRLAELTKHFARRMRLRSGGRIVQVASTAAFQPCPGYAAYAATKAFVLHHAEGLAEELRGSNVFITALCPGSTNTEFFDVSGNERNQLQTSTSLDPEDVARQAVKAMRRGKRVAVTGAFNRIGATTIRFLPRRLQAVVARKVLE